MTKGIQQSIVFAPDKHAIIKALAQKEGISFSDKVRMMVNEVLEKTKQLTLETK